MSAVSSVTRTLTQEQIARYAVAARDHNPIHIDEAFAAATPFGGTIAHGMLVLALITEMMHAAHGERWLSSGALKVRFKAPTRPADTVTAAATLTRDRAGVLEYAVQCANQRGETVIEGRASVAAG